MFPNIPGAVPERERLAGMTVVIFTFGSGLINGVRFKWGALHLHPKSQGQNRESKRLYSGMGYL